MSHTSPPSTNGNQSNASMDLEKRNESDAKSSVEMEKKPEKPEPEKTEEELPAWRVAAIIISVFMCMFLVALDRTIISTAIPAITADFNSFSDVGWYGSSYLLTCCAFQLLFGKIYTFFSVKGTYISSLLLFEIASAICGAAPNSIAFIVGRAISGVGAAGLFAGTIVCIVHTVPLHQRPKIQGLFGALFGLASVVGPLIGGAFASNVTWRWCFYINLPLGGVAGLVTAFLLKVPTRDTTKQPLLGKLAQLDVLGTFFLVPSIVCLLLALQWGGQTYAWSDGRIIALLVVFGVTFIAFACVQVFLPKTATLPPRIFQNRSVVGGFWMTLCIGSANYIFIYFLPVWFQGIKNASAVSSGLRLLPLMISMVVGSMGGGFTTGKIGYYTPYAIIGSCIMSVGAGLLTTFQVNSSEGIWIGYQVVFGFGLGLCFQTPNLAVQNTLPKQDVPIGLAFMLFGQLLGAAIFVSVGENVLGNQLVQRLSGAGIPGFNASLVTSAGVTTLFDSIPSDDRGMVLTQYNKALQHVFLAGLIISCFTVLGAVALQWKAIKKPAPPPKADAAKEVATDVNTAEKGEGSEEKK